MGQGDSFSYREVVALGIAGLLIVFALAISSTPKTVIGAGTCDSQYDTCISKPGANQSACRQVWSQCVSGKCSTPAIGAGTCNKDIECQTYCTESGTSTGGLQDCCKGGPKEGPHQPNQCKDEVDGKCEPKEEMPGMPPMLPMPMPMPKMPMPNQDACSDPAKAGTKECLCKDPSKADSPECTEDKPTTDLNPFAPGEPVDESNAPRSIVEYGKSLFDRLFGTGDGAEDTDESGNSTTVRDVTGEAGVTPAIPADPGTFRSLQPPATPASPALNNASDNSAIPTNTFGTIGDFERRAQAAEAPGGIVSRIGDAAREILTNLRRFFGIGG